MKLRTAFLPFLLLTIFWQGCSQPQTSENPEETPSLPTADLSLLDTATFAGGCFWCVEASFEQIIGVAEAVSGYAGGAEEEPTYRQVSAGITGHTETIQLYFDPQVISYETLLDIFFVAHDPTQLNRQGPDVGTQYRSAIFYHNEAQKQAAEEKIAEMVANGRYPKPIVTELNPFTTFWPAEDYHQDYQKYNPNNSYIRQVSLPKIRKVQKTFPALLKNQVP